MVTPRFIEQARTGAPMTVYGDGQQRRCFGHVLDMELGIHPLSHCEAARGHAVNLGNDEEIFTLGLAKMVRGRMGSSSEIRFVPHDVTYHPVFEDMERLFLTCRAPRSWSDCYEGV